MHLVADSGSTKTEWKIVNDKDYSLLSNGLNPMVVPGSFLETEIKSIAAYQVKAQQITQISFFGAGCAKYEAVEIIHTLLKQSFPNATIEVKSDLIAAARAIFNTDQGISCILGTGSNAAFYDGQNIIQEKPSLGYLLGDDGAGVGIGRTILKEYLYGNDFWLPLIDPLGLETDRKKIIRSLYASEKPNTLIAAYAKVALQNLTNTTVRSLVKNQFNQFFDELVEPYTTQSRSIGFVGSVAHFGSELILEICNERKLILKGIVKQPLENIIKQLES